MEKFTDIAAFD